MKTFWFDWLNFRQPRTPCPDGCGEAQTLDLLRSVRLEGAPEAELAGYREREWRRFLFTLDLCKGAEGRALEIGSSPYFTSVLVREFCAVDLTLSNYEGVAETERVHRVRWTPPGASEPVERDFAHDLFNIESDRLPYDDDSFDLVLFCEVLEHLTHDPLAALLEIRRVLKPGGRLVLTTPNAANLGNVLKMLGGRTVADRYSAYGPYGRHNREYTFAELGALLGAAGFDVTRGFTANVLFRRMSHLVFNALGLLVFTLLSPPRRSRALGQYSFVAATKRPMAAITRPDWLYRSYDAEDGAESQ